MFKIFKILTMKTYSSEKFPKVLGHYSHCVEHNGLLFLAGQLPINPETNEIPEGISAQTKQILDNINTILNEAGSNKNQVLQARIYLTDIELRGEVNNVYSEFFGEHKPARAIVPCGNLPLGCLLEIEVTAFK